MDSSSVQAGFLPPFLLGSPSTKSSQHTACKNSGAALSDDCHRVSRIQPEDGCCPICGGAVTIGLDRDAVDEYVRLNPEVDTVDEFLRQLVASRFIPEDIVRRCRIFANLLMTGSLHLVLENVNKSEDICVKFAERIADKINNPPDGTMASTAPNPQVLQFATVAQTSPPIDQSAVTGAPTDGAVPIASFGVATLLIPIMTMLM